MNGENNRFYWGSTGGGSGEVWNNVTLHSSIVNYTIGSGGNGGTSEGGINEIPNQFTSTSGGETVFGEYHLPGGGGGDSAVTVTSQATTSYIKATTAGENSGSISSPGIPGGPKTGLPETRNGGSGGNSLGKNANGYGNGGASFEIDPYCQLYKYICSSGKFGSDGAIILVFKSFN